MENSEIYKNLVFKRTIYSRNHDLIHDGDNIITEVDGEINDIKIDSSEPLSLVGEFSLSVWNLFIAKKLKIDLDELIEKYFLFKEFNSFEYIIKNKIFDINKYKKIVYINYLTLHPFYRKKGVTEEFIEFIYRNYFDNDSVIMAQVIPLQYNPVEYDFFWFHHFVKIRKNKIDINDYDCVSAKEYYNLDKFLLNKDKEMDEYKLYHLAQKCGFVRLDNTELFLLQPNVIENRILIKNNILNNF